MTRRAAALLFVLAALAGSAGCGKKEESELPKKDVAQNVVFTGADGRTLTMDELRAVPGPVPFGSIGHSKVPAEADALHKLARQAGSSGDYKKALALLEQASRLSPEWPYPVYDIAYTYLLMKDNENAKTYYKKTIQLAPRGFFTAITALDSLEREDRHELPAGTYLEFLSVEWIADPAKKAQSLKQLVERTPNFAPGWSEYASLKSDNTEKLEAIEMGLAARPDLETKGVLAINKALVLDRLGDRDGAIRLLGQLALDPQSTFASEQMAKSTLAYVAGK